MPIACAPRVVVWAVGVFGGRLLAVNPTWHRAPGLPCATRAPPPGGASRSVPAHPRRREGV